MEQPHKVVAPKGLVEKHQGRASALAKVAVEDKGLGLARVGKADVVAELVAGVSPVESSDLLDSLAVVVHSLVVLVANILVAVAERILAAAMYFDHRFADVGDHSSQAPLERASV